jgi:hypothetical protein
MLFNDLKDLLLDVPPTTAIMWAVWLGIGLLLNMWHRRARAALVYDETPKPKHRSGTRVVKAVVPTSTADAFGDLEKIFEPPSGAHRTPGESPVKPSSGAAMMQTPDLESSI